MVMHLSPTSKEFSSRLLKYARFRKEVKVERRSRNGERAALMRSSASFFLGLGRTCSLKGTFFGNPAQDRMSRITEREEQKQPS